MKKKNAFNKSGKSGKEVMKSAFNKLERAANKGVLEVAAPTGIAELDVLTTGIHPGNFWVLAGEPGVGTTACIIQILCAATTRVSALFLTNQETTDDVVLRTMARGSRLAWSRFQNGNMRPADWTAAAHWAGKMAERNWYLDVLHTQQPEGVFEAIAGWSPDLVFIDSLDGLEEPDGRTLTALKACCLKNSIAIVATVHGVTRAQQVHADVVMELMKHQGEYQQLRVVKNRQGGVGDLRLPLNLETRVLGGAETSEHSSA